MERSRGGFKSHDWYLKFASGLPRVERGDWTPGEVERGGPVYYGTNFFQLIEAIRMKRAGEQPPEGYLVMRYLERAESYGAAWENFLREKGELIDALVTALENSKSYSELCRYGLALSRGEIGGQPDFERAQEIGDIAAPIGVYYLREINKLLEVAEQEMERFGIDARDFYT